jgi:RHS repeat-associated protein
VPRHCLTHNPSTSYCAQRLGEPWIDQRTQNNIRFTFSGKERDDEPTEGSSRTPIKNKHRSEQTGYNYFGARYYNADISIWLSVDPMASERAWLTPYNYVQNNPLKLVDPTGMLDELSNANGEEKAVGASNPLASGRSNYLSTLVRSNSPYANNGSNSNQNPFNEGRNAQLPISANDVTSRNPFSPSGINWTSPENNSNRTSEQSSLSRTASTLAPYATIAVMEPTVVGEVLLGTAATLMLAYYSFENAFPKPWSTDRPKNYIPQQYNYPTGPSGNDDWIKILIGGSFAGGTAYLRYRYQQNLKLKLDNSLNTPQDNTYVQPPIIRQYHEGK